MDMFPIALNTKTTRIDISTIYSSILLPTIGNTVRIINSGSFPCFVSVHQEVATAVEFPTAGGSAVSGTYLLPDTVEVFSVPREALYVSAISTGATSLFIQCGEGV